MSGLYVVSAALLLRVPTGLGRTIEGGYGLRPRPQGNMFVEIGRGLRYVATDPRLRLLFAMLFIVTFFAMPYVMLLAGFNEEDLGKGNFEFGLLQSFMGVGALIGSLGIATLTEYERKPLVQWIAGTCGAIGLILLAIGAGVFGWWGAAVAVVFIGLAFTAYQTLNNTMVMDEARPEFYGRVMSINMLTFSSMPLMALPLGALADRIGAPETFIAQGAIVLGFMAFVALVNAGYTFGRHQSRSLQTAPAAASLASGAGFAGPGPAGGGGA
jgi:MFS family permease